MGLFTSFARWRREPSAQDYRTPRYQRVTADLNPRVARLVRDVPHVSPTTRIGTLTEMLRVSPYRAAPIVAPSLDTDQPGRLLGWITEERLVSVLLAAQTPEERAALREMTAATFTEMPEVWATTSQYATEVFEQMQANNLDVLPVVDGGFRFLGFVSRSDLVQDLTRPFRPPQVGGMATPLGVYLTTGGVSGGAGTVGLLLTGVAMFGVQAVTALVGIPLEDKLFALLPPMAKSLQSSLSLLFSTALQMALFLLLIRLTPIAGYHAAEHQVVHALERAEPLLTENVRALPRVHPRCGTNLVAGGFLFVLLGQGLQPFVGSYSYLISGLIALSYWRTFGAWLQQNLTTRPASDAQIESGIRAARELLERHDAAPFRPVPPPMRLWRMGIVQIMLGYFGMLALLLAVGWLYHPLGAALKPYTDGLL
jgi:CBS domain-containing protein